MEVLKYYVVFDGYDNKLISKHNTKRSADSKASELIDKGEYQEVGVSTYDDWLKNDKMYYPSKYQEDVFGRMGDIFRPMAKGGSINPFEVKTKKFGSLKRYTIVNKNTGVSFGRFKNKKDAEHYLDVHYMAKGGEVLDMKQISQEIKLYHKYKFDSDAAMSNGEDGKSFRLLDKAESNREEAIKLIHQFNKKNNTNFTFLDFDFNGNLVEGIASGTKVPTEYTNPTAEEGRYKYVVEVKHPYRKEEFITNFSYEQKDRDPSYQAAMQIVKDAQKDSDFKEGHIIFSYYIKGMGRSYMTIFHTDKKSMAKGGTMAEGGEIGTTYFIGRPEVGVIGRFGKKLATWKTCVVDENANKRYGHYTTSFRGSAKNLKLDGIVITQKEFDKLTFSKMAKGGMTTFDDKVQAISKRLEGTKVPKRLEKDYGKRYNHEEAIEAGRRIAGSIRKKYKMEDGGTVGNSKYTDAEIRRAMKNFFINPNEIQIIKNDDAYFAVVTEDFFINDEWYINYDEYGETVYKYFSHIREYNYPNDLRILLYYPIKKGYELDSSADVLEDDSEYFEN